MSIESAVERAGRHRTAAPLRSAEHQAELAGPADRAYRLVADVTRWPVLFPPCLAARVLESDRDSERIRLWAIVGTDVRSWTSLRLFDEERLRIDFRQEAPGPPVEWMSGHWHFEETAPDRTRMVLGHEWSVSGTPGEERRVAEALDRNSRAEGDAVAHWAELVQPLEELVFRVSEETVIHGSPHQVYDFLYRADLWPARVPHVSALDLEESADADADGALVQTLDMKTRTDDGSVHATQSVRLCFSDERIAYKQTTVPRGLRGHSGEWVLAPVEGGTRVTARHLVALDPSTVEEVFGPGTSLAEARQRAGALLSANSMRTLESCRRHTGGGPAAAGGGPR
ncbi:SRPBCC family protein [Streptomyces sp. BPTC-684]|uniref:aromatase/cyclase n=1 Tax=Streptomyces sp. BPTC-684 TaxID=3043734 RepID=UPI0024B24964|nr:SRPBCC family protein [Streptomyces sp. BPTC-684]WHM40062.1 SRPBCC family protein [Streptomyces sp. BPTC-684]